MTTENLITFIFPFIIPAYVSFRSNRDKSAFNRMEYFVNGAAHDLSLDLCDKPGTHNSNLFGPIGLSDDDFKRHFIKNTRRDYTGVDINREYLKSYLKERKELIMKDDNLLNILRFFWDSLSTYYIYSRFIRVNKIRRGKL